MQSPASGRNAGNVASNERAEAECRDRFMVIFNFRYAHYFEFLGGRTSSKGKARLRCKVCGHEFERFGNFARMDANLFCPRCHVHRDDVITVPIDGKLTEHLSEMYASGTSIERLAEETGISARYIRSLVTDDSIAAHDEEVRKANRELREAKRTAHDSIRSSFADMRREMRESNADKVLKSATAHVVKDFKHFGDVSDFISTYAPSHATCNHCGKDYLFFPDAKWYGRKKAGPYCSSRCMKKHNKHNSTVSHRLRKYGNGDKPRDSINLDAVIERDHGICYICGCKTDKTDFYYVRGRWRTIGDSYPTIDHVIPLARGGTHTWDNVRLACRQCNSAKRDTVPQGVLKP